MVVNYEHYLRIFDKNRVEVRDAYAYIARNLKRHIGNEVDRE